MTDAAFPDRLTQLRAKWEADPTSRVFLQLAEEYRHLGRVKDGLAVLEKGLKEHPGYLSALVAKGRCHLELGEGEPARAVLERVVKQDATQMVANKLLVRAYLETGEPAKARERLDLYSLLNDSDPEIEELRRRIKAMDRPAPAAEPRHMDADPFSLEPLEPPVLRRDLAADVFDLAPAPREAGAETLPGGPAAPAEAPAPGVATAQAPEAESEEPGGLLFPGLASADSRRRYLDGLGAEGLFTFAPAADDSAWLEEESATSYALAPPETAEARVVTAPAPAAEDLWDEEPPAGEPMATATLGQLYLRQGHLAEAERIFHEVLRREPDNPSARAGLEHLAGPALPEETRREARTLDAGQLLAGFQPAAGQTGAAGTTARKVFLLNRYLQRLRQGSAHDVS
jgi:tetratricopeptide (TPR) repeat protein